MSEFISLGIDPSDIRSLKDGYKHIEEIGVKANLTDKQIRSLKKSLEGAIAAMAKITTQDPFKNLAKNTGKAKAAFKELTTETKKYYSEGSKALKDTSFMKTTREAKALLLVEKQLNREIEKQAAVVKELAVVSGQGGAVLRAEARKLRIAEAQTLELEKQLGVIGIKTSAEGKSYAALKKQLAILHETNTLEKGIAATRAAADKAGKDLRTSELRKQVVLLTTTNTLEKGIAATRAAADKAGKDLRSEALKKQIRLLNETNSLEKGLASMRAAADKAGKDLRTAALDKQVRSTKRLTAETKKLTTQQKLLSGVVRGSAASFGKLWLAYGSFATVGAMAATYAAVAGVKALTTSMYDLGAAFEYNSTYAVTLDRLTGGGINIGEFKTELFDVEGVTHNVSELAGGMRELTKAGVDVKSAFIGIADISRLSVIGQIDMAEATKLTVTAMNAFASDGLNLSQVANVIAKTALSSATSIGELGNAYSYTTELSKIANMSFVDVSASLALLADVGVKGSKAGTALRTSMVRLLDPSSKLSKMMHNMNAEFSPFTSGGGLKDYSQLMTELAGIMDDMTDQQKVEVYKELFGLRAMKGGVTVVEDFIKAIGDGSSKFEGLTKSISKAKDETMFLKDMMSETSQTVTRAAEELKVAWEDALINAFDQGADEGLLKTLHELRTVVESPEFGQGLVMVATAMGNIAVAMASIVAAGPGAVTSLRDMDLGEQLGATAILSSIPGGGTIAASLPVWKAVLNWLIPPEDEIAKAKAAQAEVELLAQRVIKMPTSAPSALDSLVMSASTTHSTSGSASDSWALMERESMKGYAKLMADREKHSQYLIAASLEEVNIKRNSSKELTAVYEIEQKVLDATLKNKLISESAYAKQSLAISEAIMQDKQSVAKKELSYLLEVKRIMGGSAKYDSTAGDAAIKAQYDKIKLLNDEVLLTEKLRDINKQGRDLARSKEQSKLLTDLEKDYLNVTKGVSAYAAELERINLIFDKKASKYGDRVDPQAIADLKLIEGYRERAIADSTKLDKLSGDFWRGFGAAVKDSTRDLKTFSEVGYESFGFLKSGIKDSFVAIFKGEFDKIGDIWDATLNSMLDSVIDWAAEAATNFVMEQSIDFLFGEGSAAKMGLGSGPSGNAGDPVHVTMEGGGVGESGGILDVVDGWDKWLDVYDNLADATMADGKIFGDSGVGESITGVFNDDSGGLFSGMTAHETSQAWSDFTDVVSRGIESAVQLDGSVWGDSGAGETITGIFADDSWYEGLTDGMSDTWNSVKETMAPLKATWESVKPYVGAATGAYSVYSGIQQGGVGGALQTAGGVTSLAGNEIVQKLIPALKDYSSAIGVAGAGLGAVGGAYGVYQGLANEDYIGATSSAIQTGLAGATLYAEIAAANIASATVAGGAGGMGVAGGAATAGMSSGTGGVAAGLSSTGVLIPLAMLTAVATSAFEGSKRHDYNTTAYGDFELKDRGETRIQALYGAMEKLSSWVQPNELNSVTERGHGDTFAPWKTSRTSDEYTEKANQYLASMGEEFNYAMANMALAIEPTMASFGNFIASTTGVGLSAEQLSMTMNSALSASFGNTKELEALEASLISLGMSIPDATLAAVGMAGAMGETAEYMTEEQRKVEWQKAPTDVDRSVYGDGIFDSGYVLNFTDLMKGSVVALDEMTSGTKIFGKTALETVTDLEIARLKEIESQKGVVGALSDSTGGVEASFASLASGAADTSMAVIDFSEHISGLYGAVGSLGGSIDGLSNNLNQSGQAVESFKGGLGLVEASFASLASGAADTSMRVMKLDGTFEGLGEVLGETTVVSSEMGYELLRAHQPMVAFGSAASSTAGTFEELEGVLGSLGSGAIGASHDIMSAVSAMGQGIQLPNQEGHTSYNANGAVMSYHARGGVMDRPTVFHVGGEAGSEAIMPLHNGPNTLKLMDDKIDALSDRPVVVNIVGDEGGLKRFIRVEADIHVTDKLQRGQGTQRVVF